MRLSNTLIKLFSATLFCLNCCALIVCNIVLIFALILHGQSERIGDVLVVYNSRSLIASLVIVSLLSLLLHAVASKLFYECIFSEGRNAWMSVLFYWMCVCVVAVAMCVCMLANLRAHNSKFLQHVTLGLKSFLRDYKTSARARSFINRLQTEYACCGVRSPEDWHSVPWLDFSAVVPVSRLAKSEFMRPDGQFVPRWAPYSCCRMNLLDVPCQSAQVFFEPRKSTTWMNASHVLSLEFLAQYDKYKRLFPLLQQLWHNSTSQNKLEQEGRRLLVERGRHFISFLTSSSRDTAASVTVNVASEAANVLTANFSSSPPDDDDSYNSSSKVASMRLMFEAHGVHAEAFPDAALRQFVATPPQLPPVRQWWDAAMLDTFEADNLNQLLRFDHKQSTEVLGVLERRVFYRRGCARILYESASETVARFTLLFAFVTFAQLVSLMVGCFIYLSMKTAAKTTNNDAPITPETSQNLDE